MKKALIHTVPVIISFVWLIVLHQTSNPVILKGPEFLKFYLILVAGFYASVFILNSMKEAISGTTLYFAGAIFLLGMIKLVRGVMLGKPVGFLVMILIVESIAGALLIQYKLKNRIKR